MVLASFPRGGIAIFSKRISGADNPVQFILPVEPTFPDERRRVADALRTLAQIEGCSEAEIANKVRQTSSPSRGLESKNADVLKSKKDTSIVMSGKTDSSVTNDAIESTAQHLRESLGLSDQS
jgi:hypothetical protein